MAGVTVKWGKPQTRRLPGWQYAESPVMIVPNYLLASCRNTDHNCAESPVDVFVRGVTPCYPPTCDIFPESLTRNSAERLAATGAVVVEGPKACGKTATGRHAAASEVLLDVDRNARRMVGVDPDAVLRGRTPRLIDEWQTEPDIWNYVRRAVDDRAAPGQFILTGSAVPPDDITRHTGAGRLTRLRIRPFFTLRSRTFLRGHLATTANER